MRLAIAASLVLLSGCAHNDPWTTRDTWMQVGLTAVLVADAYTTNNIQDTPEVWENGPLAQYVLGKQPSTSATIQYFGTVIIAQYFITRALPAKWRPYWQGANIVNHANWIRINCDLGLC